MQALGYSSQSVVEYCQHSSAIKTIEIHQFLQLNSGLPTAKPEKKGPLLQQRICDTLLAQNYQSVSWEKHND